jgi:hypothetical protein
MEMLPIRSSFFSSLTSRVLLLEKYEISNIHQKRYPNPADFH